MQVSGEVGVCAGPGGTEPFAVELFVQGIGVGEARQGEEKRKARHVSRVTAVCVVDGFAVF